MTDFASITADFTTPHFSVDLPIVDNSTGNWLFSACEIVSHLCRCADDSHVLRITLSHVAPLGLGGVGIRRCYKHVAPLGLKDLLEIGAGMPLPQTVVPYTDADAITCRPVPINRDSKLGIKDPIILFLPLSGLALSMPYPLRLYAPFV